MSLYISGGDAVAKRKHRRACDECKGTIKRGRPYRALTLLDNERPYTYKLCGRCARWADEFERKTGECEWSLGDIEQYRFDAIREMLALRKKRPALLVTQKSNSGELKNEGEE